MARYGKARRFEFQGAVATANEHADRLGVTANSVYQKFYKSNAKVLKVGAAGQSSQKKPEPTTTYFKICLGCGSQFETILPRHKYCSKRCYPKKQHKPHIPKIHHILCSCGQTFKTDNRGKKFCSRKCRPSGKRSRKSKFYHKECQVCKTAFQTHYSLQKFCSNKCSDKNKRTLKSRLVFKPASCECCQKTLSIPRPKAKRFCSKACANRKKTFKGLTSDPGECRICRAPLKIPRQPKSKYCSRKCNRKACEKAQQKRPEVKLRNSLAKALRQALRNRHPESKKDDSILKYTGCTMRQLKSQFESQFSEGMTWGNHSTFGWHIDHIIPLSKFDLSKEDHRNVALHHSNLRPLWWKKNLAKSATITIEVSEELHRKASMLGIFILR